MLQALCKQNLGKLHPKISIVSVHWRLKGEAETLSLWGEPFENGKLDKALDKSEELKEMVLLLDFDAGQILTNSK